MAGHTPAGPASDCRGVRGSGHSLSAPEIFEIKRESAGMTWEQFGGYLASTTHTNRVMTLKEMANVAALVASDKASGLTVTTVNLTMGSLDD